MPSYVNLGLLFIDIVLVYNLVSSIKNKEYLIWQEQSIIAVVLLASINIVNFFHNNINFILAWLVLFCLNFYIPWYLKRKFNYAIYLPNENRIKKYAKLLSFFLPGPQGAYYLKMADAYLAVIDEDYSKAKNIINEINSTKTHPIASQNLLISDMVFLSLTKNWTKIIEDYNILKQKNSPLINFFHLSAARAYLELDDLANSMECFKLANLSQQITEIKQLAIFLIPYYANLGVIETTEKLLGIARYNNHKLNKYYTNYIKALTYYRNNEFNKALNYLEQAKKYLSVENASKYWLNNCSRLNQLISEQTNKNIDNTLKKDFVTILNACFKKVYIVNSFTNIIKMPSIIVWLILSMAIIYIYEVGLFSYNPNIISDNFHYNHFVMVLNSFALAKITNISQCYRLITYSFLHANLIHLSVNLFGLYWFGPIIIQIFNQKTFLILWVLGAITGGLFHICFDNHLYVVGCSASLMALWGAYIMALFKSNDLLGPKLRNLEIRFCLIALVIQFMIEKLIPQIDSQAHLGGMIIGIIIGAIFNINDKFDNNKEII